jgi:transcriptional regulator with XRE-family HTH domain
MNTNDTIQSKFKKILTIKNKEEKTKILTSMIHLDIMSEITNLMELKSINKTELAKKLNVSKSYITQLFTADKLINLKLIAQIQDIFDVKFSISLYGNFTGSVPLEKQALINEIANRDNISTNRLTQNMLEQGIALKMFNNVQSIACAKFKTLDAVIGFEEKIGSKSFEPITANQNNSRNEMTA